MNILVTGGAGYIGSHTVHLLQKNHNVVVLDNLSNGRESAINVPLIKGEIGNREILDKIMKEHNIDAVIHFAGLIEAGESMKNPSTFFEHNVKQGLVLLDAMIKNNVKKMVYSSSAAVYKTKNEQLSEDDPKGPASVYGETKLIFENILKWYDKVHGLKYVALRYFNAAGAGFNLGECHNPETHLLPLILEVALGKRDHIKIFGTDYNTKDGTCVRDYIHVVDLATAHIKALEHLKETSKSYNVGVGKGYSVKEIIELAREITKKEIVAIDSDRRPGDPEILVANSNKIKEELGWIPEFDIRKIIESAWEFHQSHFLKD